MRHANSDDEWVAPAKQHLDALRALDQHPALDVLTRARQARTVDDLLVDLFRDAAVEASGATFAPPDERMFYLDPEECPACWRLTFLLDGFDDFGGTNASGMCVACGHRRSEHQARDLALAAEWERWSAANP